MKFKQMSNIKSRTWVGAVAGILSLTVAAVTQAAFVPVPITSTETGSPVLLGAGTVSAGNAVGTVVSFSEKTWNSGAGAFGSLRSMVVNNGGTADFYYQINNLSAPNAGNDIFRMVANGFASGTVNATYLTTSPFTSLNTTAIPAGVLAGWGSGVTDNGAATVYEADQSPMLGVPGTTVGFDFDINQFIKGVPYAPNGDATRGSELCTITCKY